MKLYNTLTKKIEEFVPHKGKEVTMYTCGPTVYGFAHIGNLRTYIYEDVLEKSLIYLGYEVKRAMNITDVGHIVGDQDEGKDKMSLAKERENKTALKIADYYTEAFKKDFESLNCSWPQIVVRATKEIDYYIEIIEKLLDLGVAYKSNGNIYFDITKYDKYYELSGRNKEEQLTAVRTDVEEDSSKRNPGDFGLWFTNSKFDDQELKWDSPFGVGYPGWHIECTGIAIKYLGEYLDLHMGAVDAIFPHHTNEIAQSEAFLGHKWCSYWVHPEFLNDESGKMSKSKGKVLTVEVLKENNFLPVEYRFFCLKSHYRRQLVFSFESLKVAANEHKKLKNKIMNLEKENNTLAINYVEKIKEYLSNDLNTANVISLIYDILKDDEITDSQKYNTIREIDNVLSLDFFEQEKFSEEEKNEIEKLIEERKIAKENKNYELADKIRNNLLEKNIVLKDTSKGTLYERKN